jgi:branched-chain amino acid transport system permease protein
MRAPPGLGWEGRARLAAPVAIVAAGVVAALLGGLLTKYELDLAITLLSYVVLAHAWNALAGFGGQVSLGVGAFLGTGAYAAALLMIHAATPFPVAVLGAGCASGLLALLLAVPLLRLHGDYFAVGTLAVTLALEAFALNWPYAGRSQGLGLPAALLPDQPTLFELAVAVTVAAFLVTTWIQHSRFGLRLMAVRDDEAAATGLGVSAFRHRLLVFVLSSVLTGLAGAVLALQQLSFEPTGILSINWTVDALLMTIVGGMGTFFGPTLGAVLVYYGVTTVLAGLQAMGLVIEGVLLVAIVRFAPQGLWPLAVQGVRAAIGGRLGRLGRLGRPAGAAD